MRIKNARLFPTALAFGKRSLDQPFLSVILKATFRLRGSTGAAKVAEAQLPIFGEDVPYDAKKPGGLLRFESDRVPFKPRADIVLVGTAYAEHGHPTERMDVRLRVGRTDKTLRVVGDRLWSFPRETDPPIIVGPAPFTKMPLTYDRAFGGVDPHGKVTKDAPEARPWCARNFEGRGFTAEKTVQSLHRKALPNIEDPEHPVRSWDSRPKPVGLGFFPRNSEPRSRYLGTYDAKWKTERAPELPLDFRFDFFNGAHPDLQVPEYLVGNEPVRLRGVTEEKSALELILPCIQPVLTVDSEPSGTGTVAVPGVAPGTERRRILPALDTAVFVPDEGIFYLVWRGIVPIRRTDASDVVELRIEYEDLPAYDAREDARSRRS